MLLSLTSCFLFFQLLLCGACLRAQAELKWYSSVFMSINGIYGDISISKKAGCKLHGGSLTPLNSAQLQVLTDLPKYRPTVREERGDSFPLNLQQKKPWFAKNRNYVILRGWNLLDAKS